MVESCLLATLPRASREIGDENMLRDKLITKKVMSNGTRPEVTLLMLMEAQKSPQHTCR
jgi:hypothetical protein